MGVKRKCKWTKEERQALLGYLSERDNYQRLKKAAKKVWNELSLDTGLFRGTRSAKALKAQWDDLKKRHEEARMRVESTGEGAKSDEQWISMENSEFASFCVLHIAQFSNEQIDWLNKICPDYRFIAEILQKGNSFTAPFVSESAGSNIRSRNLVNGIEAEEIESSTSGSGSGSDSFSEREGDYHPPAGGNPKNGKRKASQQNSRGGKKAIKKNTSTQEADAIESVAKQWLALEREKLEYLRDTDREDRKMAAEREKNRHELRLMQERRLDQEFQLRLREFDRKISRMGNGSGSGHAGEEEDGDV